MLLGAKVQGTREINNSFRYWEEKWEKCLLHNAEDPDIQQQTHAYTRGSLCTDTQMSLGKCLAHSMLVTP